MTFTNFILPVVGIACIGFAVAGVAMWLCVRWLDVTTTSDVRANQH